MVYDGYVKYEEAEIHRSAIMQDFRDTVEPAHRRYISIQNAILENGQVSSHRRLAAHKRAVHSRFYCSEKIKIKKKDGRLAAILDFLV